MSDGERKAFKLWFDADLVAALGEELARVEARFDRARFEAAATEGLDDLEMMARVGRIADALHLALPRPTAAAMGALVAALPERLGGAEGVTEAGYRFWPFGEYIARYGLDDVEASFGAMIALTQRFTSEFAVRPFLEADLDGILGRLEALVDHPSQHVRRWVSEGTRTRLPWGKKVAGLAATAGRRLALLERLHRDPERYVQRSVANHLQDILKDDLAAGLPTLAAWAREEHEGARWIARHAARGLLKAGHPEVMALFGYGGAPPRVEAFTATPRAIAVGDTVTLSARLVDGGQGGLVRLDYALTSPTATGRRSRKVFRWAERELAEGEVWVADKRHAFVPRSIRAVVPGEHELALIANGEELARVRVVVGLG